MLEVLIIIFLGLALFLLLRHYPDAKEVKFSLSKIDFSRFQKLLTNRRPHKIDSIIAAPMQRNMTAVESEDDNFAPQPKIAKVFSEKSPMLLSHLYKAEEAYEANDLREAEVQALEAIAKDNRCAEAYVMIGKIAFFRGEFADSREAYKAALKCNKNLAEAYFGTGMVEMREDNFTKAIDHMEKAINLEKGNAEWYFELGKSYIEIRQYAKAAKVLKKAASIDIDNKDYKSLAAEAEEKQRTHSVYSRLR
ncbi:MAG: tetratricopeptide repeat protein [Patescibacteria group bacterium]